MKRLTFLFTLTITVVSTLTTLGQELYKCSTTKSFWTFTLDNSSFVIKLSGKANETERKNVISLDNYALQSLVVDKVKFKKEGEDSTDLEVLIRYALSEAEYFTGLFKTTINIKMQKAPLATGESALIWFFEMPPGQNEEVKFQLFANIIAEDKIFGLASPQFVNQKFESVRDLLMDTISTFKKVDSKNDLGELCKN